MRRGGALTECTAKQSNYRREGIINNLCLFYYQSCDYDVGILYKKSSLYLHPIIL